MKAAALLAASLVGLVATQRVFAQGQIFWGNAIGTWLRAPVYGVDPVNPILRNSGNTATGIPAGTQTYGGALLSGTGFTMAIYVGASPSEVVASVQHLQTATFRTGTAAGFVLARTATDPSRVPGTTGLYVHFRAWDNVQGTIMSWSELLTRGGAGAAGCSDVFTIGPLGGVSNGNIFLVPQTTGFRSFNISVLPFCPIPEPSVIVLGALGLGALLLRRRA